MKTALHMPHTITIEQARQLAEEPGVVIHWRPQKADEKHSEEHMEHTEHTEFCIQKTSIAKSSFARGVGQ